MASLYRHLKQQDKCESNESGKSGYGCKYCGVKFQDGMDLYHHMKKLYSDQKSREGETTQLNEKKTKCDRCGFIFKHTNLLSRHMKLCAGDSNFKCKTCGHPYQRRDSLVRHMKSCSQALEQKARKKNPKRSETKSANPKTKEKSWQHHGVGKNHTEMLYVSTSTRISR